MPKIGHALFALGKLVVVGICKKVRLTTPYYALLPPSAVCTDGRWNALFYLKTDLRLHPGRKQGMPYPLSPTFQAAV